MSCQRILAIALLTFFTLASIALLLGGAISIHRRNQANNSFSLSTCTVDSVEEIVCQAHDGSIPCYKITLSGEVCGTTATLDWTSMASYKKGSPIPCYKNEDTCNLEDENQHQGHGIGVLAVMIGVVGLVICAAGWCAIFKGKF